VRSKARPIEITVAASDPILLAVAPGTSRVDVGQSRHEANIDGRFRMDRPIRF
jgi:hypothetical protein